MNTGHVLGLVLVLATAQAAAGVAVAGASQGPAESAAAAQEQVTVTLQIVDDHGSSVPNAEVTASWDGGEEVVTTRSNGQALIDVPEGARVEVTVDHAGYTRNHPYVIENAASETVEITVWGKAETNVEVVEDGQPIEDALVVLYKGGRIASQGRTGSDGVYNSGTIERGTYRARVVKSGYFENQTTYYVDGITERTVAIEQGTVSVDVTVRDDHFDAPRPVEGASVEFGEVATLRTGSSGRAGVQLPVNTDLQVTVTKDGYTRVRRTISIDEVDKQIRFTITRRPALNLTALNERILAGDSVQLEVVDEYGAPAEGADVVVDGEVVGQTDAQGIYRAQLDDIGEHTILVRGEDADSNEVTVEAVEAASQATATPSPTPTATPSPTPTATPSPTPTATDSPTATPEPSGGLMDQLPTFGQPRIVVQAAGAVLGLLLVLFVFRLLR